MLEVDQISVLRVNYRLDINGLQLQVHYQFILNIHDCVWACTRKRQRSLKGQIQPIIKQMGVSLQ